MSEYHARIRAARAYAGLTREELAAALGMSASTYSNIEHADHPSSREPRPAELVAIAYECGVPVWFMRHGFDGRLR
jgi:transcriptional regulator with XRE-family HTH domain